MLIAIAIAEEIQGLQRIALVPKSSGGPPWALSVPHEPIFFEDLFRLRPGLLVFSLRFEIKLIEHGGQEVSSDTFLILGSLLQWRWQ